MHTLRIISLCLASAIACSPKDPTDTETSSDSTGAPGSSSGGSSGETPTTGTPTTGTSDGSSGSVSATGDETSGTGGTTATGEPMTSGATDPPETGTSTGDDTTGDGTTGVNVACDIGMSNLDGVCIVFPPQKDSFTLAEAKAGIEFQYVLVVTADVPAVMTEPLETCDEPTAGGLYMLERVEGDGQAYCVCDNGLCMDPDDPPFTLKAGEYPATFAWDGVNWNGPSDTNNPKGPQFPPGTYTVEVVTHGTHEGQDYEVVGELPITITQ
jgi:hypothetical protein